MNIAALVLAAGQSRRMQRLEDCRGGSKLALSCRGETLLAHCIKQLAPLPLVGRWVVTGFDSERLRSSVGEHTDIHWLHNEAPSRGLSHSLVLGIEALLQTEPEVDAVMVVLADMPDLKTAHYGALLEQARLHTGAIVVPSVGDKPGNPLIWPRECWSALLALQGDRGARALLADFQDRVLEFNSDDEAYCLDLDTPEDWYRFSAQTDA